MWFLATSLNPYQCCWHNGYVLHIENGLIHEGLESNREFLNKTKLAIENLSKLYDNVTDKRTFARTVNIVQTYNSLRFFRLTQLLSRIYIRFRDRMEIHLESGKISILLFRFYKVSMFCTYREIHKRKKANPVF